MKEICGIWLPDDDTHFEKHLEAGAGTYQEKKFLAALEVIPDNRRRTAIDVGAHVGLWSRRMAAHFDRVIAFEPHPLLVECYRKNLHDRDNVLLFGAIVTDKERKGDRASVTYVPGNSGNTHVEINQPGNDTRSVRTTALDEMQFDDVDLVKIDVEGWEVPVVLGARETLLKHKPFVVIEQKPDNAERYGLARFDALYLLQSLGMVVLWEKSGDFCLGWE